MNEAQFKINGELLPTPSSISVSIEDLDSEGSIRDVVDGILDREVTRQGVLIYSLSYKLSTFPDISKILALTKPKDFMVEAYVPNHCLHEIFKGYSAKKGYNYIRTQSGLKPESFSLVITQC